LSRPLPGGTVSSMYEVYLWVAIGGALGTVGRFWVAAAMARLTGPAFPWGTLLINVLGSFVIGLSLRLTGSGGNFPLPFDIRIFIMVGLCGGFTTFSSFSLQTTELLRSRPQWGLAYIALSVGLCLAATWIGSLL
jgi:CrcB protein